MLAYEGGAHVLHQAGEVWAGVLRPDSHIVIGAGKSTLLLAGVETAQAITGGDWKGAGVLVDANRQLGRPASAYRVLESNDEYIIGGSAGNRQSGAFAPLYDSKRIAGHQARVLTRNTGTDTATVVQHLSDTHETSVEILPPPTQAAELPVNANFETDLESLATWLVSNRQHIREARRNARSGSRKTIAHELSALLLHDWYRVLPAPLRGGSVPSQHDFNQQLQARSTSHVRVGSWHHAATHDDVDYNYPIGRIYVNGRADRLPALFDRIVHGLHDRDVDAHVKMAVDVQGAYHRSDALVAYFNHYDTGTVVDLVTDEQIVPTAQMRPSIPRLSAQLHRADGSVMTGVAFAQSPAGHHSFGQSRVGLLAEAMLEGMQTPDEFAVALSSPMATRRWGINPINPALGRYVRGFDPILKRL